MTLMFASSTCNMCVYAIETCSCQIAGRVWSGRAIAGVFANVSISCFPEPVEEAEGSDEEEEESEGGSEVRWAFCGSMRRVMSASCLGGCRATRKGLSDADGAGLSM